LKTLTDVAVRQLSGREFQSLGALTEKRRAAMSMLCLMLANNGKIETNFSLLNVNNHEMIQ